MPATDLSGQKGKVIGGRGKLQLRTLAKHVLSRRKLPVHAEHAPGPPPQPLRPHHPLLAPTFLPLQSTVNPAARGTPLGLNKITSPQTQTLLWLPASRRAPQLTHQHHSIRHQCPFPSQQPPPHHALPLSFHWLHSLTHLHISPEPCPVSGLFTNCSLSSRILPQLIQIRSLLSCPLLRGSPH